MLYGWRCLSIRNQLPGVVDGMQLSQPADRIWTECSPQKLSRRLPLAPNPQPRPFSRQDAAVQVLHNTPAASSRCNRRSHCLDVGAVLGLWTRQRQAAGMTCRRLPAHDFTLPPDASPGVLHSRAAVRPGPWQLARGIYMQSRLHLWPVEVNGHFQVHTRIILRDPICCPGCSTCSEPVKALAAVRAAAAAGH